MPNHSSSTQTYFNPHRINLKISLPSNLSVHKPNSNDNTHHMQTRATNGIYKPKASNAIVILLVPRNVIKAMKHKEYMEVMGK